MALRWAGRLLSNVRDFYSDMNPATLNGAIDVIVIRQENGSFLSSGWHVRFGKMGVLRPKENVVDIEINGKPVDLNMRLGVMGEAFFVQESNFSLKNEEKNESTFDTNDIIDPLWKNRCETPPDNTNSISSDEEHFINSSRPVNKYLNGMLVSDLSSSCPNVSQTFLGNAEYSNENVYKVISFNTNSGEEINFTDPLIFNEEINTKLSNDSDIDKIEFSIEPIETSNVRKKSNDEYLRMNCDVQLDKIINLQKIGDEEIFEIEMDENIDGKVITRKNGSSTSLTKYNSSPELNDLNVVSVLDPYFDGITIGSLPEKKSESWISERNSKIENQNTKEIFLSDLDQKDSNFVEMYLYGQSDRGDNMSTSSPQRSSPECDQHHFNHSAFYELEKDNICLSLCGGLETDFQNNFTVKFNESIVSFQEFTANPNILSDPRLVFRIRNEYYKFQVAAPIILSKLIFKQPITELMRMNLIHQYMPRKEPRRRWLNWFGGAAEEDTLISSSLNSTFITDTNSKDILNSKNISSQKDIVNLQEAVKSTTEVVNLGKTTNLASKRSIYLSSEQILKLDLNEGYNEATFSVTTQYQGTTKCSCSVYLWNVTDRIVVSDIDGTITKSDVLGQVLPLIGTDWSQVGIAHLYSLIEKNGYRFLYLSARAIGQSRSTRGLLKSIRQGDFELPDGPLLLSPMSLRNAFHKEVIERKPEEFKIECLRNILKLFPPYINNPLTAGFGNRINDVWAYNSVGIPKSRIFIVNHKGQLHMESSSFTSTYSKLGDLVDHLFPPLAHDTKQHRSSCTSEYSNFNFWRTPISTNQQLIDVYIQNRLKNQRSRSKSRSWNLN